MSKSYIKKRRRENESLLTTARRLAKEGDKEDSAKAKTWIANKKPKRKFRKPKIAPTTSTSLSAEKPQRKKK